jgi:hypothetical protein
MNKTCTKCGETKPTTEFYKRSDARDGLQAHCKSCKKARSKAWYEANREEKKASSKAYREANPEKIKARRKAYCEANREKIKASSKTYREANSEKIKAYDKARHGTPARKFSEYKNNARVRGIPFLMEFQQFEGLWQKPCYYCGAEIKTIGLDRVYNDGPYHIDNVVPCCQSCNTSKGALPLEEWLERKNDVEVA